MWTWSTGESLLLLTCWRCTGGLGVPSTARSNLPFFGCANSSSVLFVCTKIFFSVKLIVLFDWNYPLEQTSLKSSYFLDFSWPDTLCLIAWFLFGTRSSRTCVISGGKVSLLDRYQTPIFLAVTGVWGSGKVSLLASKMFTNVVVTCHGSCVFLYLLPSANISPVSIVLHLQDWWCVGKRETSFPVNKLWLIYLLPCLWPITMKNRYACKF